MFDDAMRERLRYRIEHYKELREMTLNDISRSGGIPTGSVRSLLYGVCNPTLDTIVKLAWAFEVPVALFLDGICDDPIMFGTGYETRSK